MEEIAQNLKVNLNKTKRNYLYLEASSKESRTILVNYLTKYPLKGIKDLDYKDWLLVNNLLDKKSKDNKLDIDYIKSIKDRMNDKRPF